MLTNEQRKMVRRAVYRELAIAVVCFTIGFAAVRLIGA